jgi:hypothetical protein
LRKKRQTIQDTSVESLLDDLLNPEVVGETRPAEDPWSEEYLTKLHKIEARRTIEKYRKNEPFVAEKPSAKVERPIISEKFSGVRKCQNCYYCIGTRKVGGAWWCHCTNPGRSTEVEVQTQPWVKSGLNLPCWKIPD